MAKPKPKKKHKATKPKLTKTPKLSKGLTTSAETLPAPTPISDTLLTQARQAPRKPTSSNRLAIVMIMTFVLVMSFWGLYQQIGTHQANSNLTLVPLPDSVVAQANALPDQIQRFEATEKASEHKLVPDSQLTGSYHAIQEAIKSGYFAAAYSRLFSFQKQLNDLNKQLSETLKQTPSPTPFIPPYGSVFLPVLLFHNTPGDFVAQLEYLKNNGYTTVTMDDAAAILAGQITGPTKPVAITFDDGLADQWQAYQLLVQYQMKATFYIIDGGVGSTFHIGANRVLPDPQGGPGYLTWDQIRSLDQSGLIEIGAHTVDHLDLAVQTQSVQQFEIVDGKTQLETQIGHPVYSFAYPYGRYNATTVGIVQAAGFTSAVTTNPTSYQFPGSPFTMGRVREAIGLP